MAKNNNPNRTTLWDDPGGVEVSAPPTAASSSRGAWRAPSAVLAGDRPSVLQSRRVVGAMPSVTGLGSPSDDLDELDGDTGPIPRRTNLAAPQNPWWRPRTNFGRILLGTGALVFAGALTAAGLITRKFLTHDPHFRIAGSSNIQSTGLSEVNRADVLPVFGEDIGRNVFFVPLAERRKQLEAIPWVQQATVMRFLPDHVSVSIVERTPVAFVRQGQQVELADADGVILSMPPAMMGQHHYSFPVVNGIDSADSLPARRIRMAVYQRFLAELAQKDPHLSDQISEIDVTDPEDLRATMPAEGSDVLVHFGEDQFLHRLEIYQSHIAEWRQRYPKLIGVDLRYNGEVPLEMSTDAGSPSATAQTVSPAGAATVAVPAAPAPKPAAKADPKPASASTSSASTGSATTGHATTVSATAEHAAARKAADKKKAARLKAEKAKSRTKAAQKKPGAGATQ